MSRRPPRSTRTDTRVPYTARFRSKRRRGGGRGLRRHLFVADGAAGGQGEDAEQGAGECMALHGCLPWWSGWRTARPRQWGYGEYASRAEEHTSELQSLMRLSYAVFCLKKNS